MRGEVGKKSKFGLLEAGLVASIVTTVLVEMLERLRESRKRDGGFYIRADASRIARPY